MKIYRFTLYLTKGRLVTEDLGEFKEEKFFYSQGHQTIRKDLINKPSGIRKRTVYLLENTPDVALKIIKEQLKEELTELNKQLAVHEHEMTLVDKLTQSNKADQPHVVYLYAIVNKQLVIERFIARECEKSYVCNRRRFLKKFVGKTFSCVGRPNECLLLEFNPEKAFEIFMNDAVTKERRNKLLAIQHQFKPDKTSE